MRGEERGGRGRGDGGDDGRGAPGGYRGRAGERDERGNYRGKGGGAGRGDGRGGRRRDERGWGGKSGRGDDRRAEGRRPGPVSAGAGAAELPKWMRDELRRVTGKERLSAVTAAVTRAVEAFADEQYEKARRELQKAKAASGRATCVRELLGLAAYHTENWREAVAELRAYRRMAGDSIYMPAEMDALRALGDSEAVEKTWMRFQEVGGPPPADSEARVVYGSFLLDEGRPREAWSVTRPNQAPSPNPPPHLLRRWYVAARAAAALGDSRTARQLAVAVREADPEMPGWEQLSAEIERVAE